MRVDPDSIHECQDCTYVASKADIVVSKEVLESVKKKAIFLGLFSMPGWSDHNPVYAYKCPACGEISISHPQEHNPYFICLDCVKPRQPLAGRTDIYTKDHKFYEKNPPPKYLDLVLDKGESFGTNDSLISVEEGENFEPFNPKARGRTNVVSGSEHLWIVLFVFVACVIIYSSSC